MDTIERYLHALGSSEPEPGGGSAAALVGATAAALVGMVARICAPNPKYAAQASNIAGLVAQSDRLVEDFAAARERDERAFASVVAAQRLPKDTQARRLTRRKELDAALAAAARAPLDASQLCLSVLNAAVALLEIGNDHLISDVGCAAEFAFAALAACSYNVRINHRYATDKGDASEHRRILSDRQTQADDAIARVRAAVARMLG